MRTRALISAWVALGCGLAPPATDEASDGSSEDAGSETATSTEAGPDPLEKPIPCESTDACEDGFCVAAYDPGAADPIGQSVCVAQCVGAQVLDRYCVDDEACCAPLHCDAQGLCAEPVDGDETTTG